MALPTFNPLPTTQASGTFGSSTLGYIAGSLYPDAASRNKIRQGFIDPSVSALMYGGVGIAVNTAKAASPMMNPTLTLAAAIANLQGFLCWDQSAASIQIPQSAVPLAEPAMGFSFVEFGSGVCIALPISATNAANLLSATGALIQDNQDLSWDYTNQVVIPYTNTGGNAGAIPGPAWNGTLSQYVARIIEVQIGNSWVVTPNSPVSGEANWNESGAVVVLQI